MCETFTETWILPGAVELPLSCAQVLDPDNIGLEHWLVNAPASDPRIEFAERRQKCYELVLDSLSLFEENATKAMQSGMDDPETIRTHAYELAFSSTDEMFHSTMYDWLIDRGLADELLEVGLPVCSHIEISPQIVPDASSLHRGAPQTRTRQCPEMSTTMAVLCQGRTTSPGSRSAWCSSRIHGVSYDAV